MSTSTSLGVLVITMSVSTAGSQILLIKSSIVISTLFNKVIQETRVKSKTLFDESIKVTAPRQHISVECDR